MGELSAAVKILATLSVLLVDLVLCDQLHSTELAALKDIRTSLRDMPGSGFFTTWNFELDPCHFFTGVACESTHGQKHVTALNLGSGYAGDAGLTGELSPSLGSLPYLRELTLAPGMVAGGIPASLGQLRELQFMGISKNRLTGSIPASFGGLISLQVLDLSNNRLTGAIPGELALLSNLITVILSDNSLSGSIPSFSSGQIAHIDLSRNTLMGSLPPLAHSLTYLSLQRNRLGGGLNPLEVLKGLNYLDLSFNQFSGSVPAAVFDLKLSVLHLQHNTLSGWSAPERPVQIRILDLSNNQISGDLSPFLASAQILYLNNNRLAGIVPFAYLTSLLSSHLQILYLQHNYLTGMQIHSHMSLPPSSSLCIQYNCMVPPKQSTCPLESGRQVSRPSLQCTIHS